MKEDDILYKNKYYNRSIRLRGYDYSAAGYYFVTICTHNFQRFFGCVNGGQVRLSKIGKITNSLWLEIPEHYPNAGLDEYIIMPNHFHGIIKIRTVETRHGVSLHRNKTLKAEYRAEFGKPQKGSLSTIINQYKAAVTRYANKNNIYFKWQPKFYDRVVRNELELNKIRRYINDNPLKWEYQNKHVDNLFY